MPIQRWCALLVLLSCVAPAQGQTPEDTTVVRGTRVRITAAALARPMIGTLEGRGLDSLVWRPEQDERLVSLPLKSVQRLEISQGRRADTWRGALIGALVGIAAGTVVGLAAGSDDCPRTGLAAFGAVDCFTRGEAAAGGAAVGAIGGGVIGLLIGSSRKSERWRTVSPARLHVGWQRDQPGIVTLMIAIPTREERGTAQW